MIVFKNKGDIDIAAIKTFGVSVKNDPDSAIGYFGTGLKYAIAVCLRNGCGIDIFDGREVQSFGYVTKKIRGKEFRIVTMNGEELGFTLDLGRDWEMWQAYRELHSNMLDEGGSVCRVPDDHFPPYVFGETMIIATGDRIESAFNDRHQTFIHVDPVAEDDTIQAFEGDGRTIYFMGIRVNRSTRECVYNYNFKSRHYCDLTEDRTMKYDFQYQYAAQALIMQSENEPFLRRVLTSPPTMFEGGLDYLSRCRSDTKPGETFLRVIGELREEQKDNGINVSAVLLHKRKREHSILPTKTIKLNSVERKMLKRARNFVRETLELDLRKFPLIVVEDLAGDLGRADMKENVMYISRKVFAQGTKRVAIALIEEFTHLDKRVLDETVEQKWIYLELIASLGERINGEPL
jgi:hypothetical protein